jgi:nucleoside-diphosphate-sugar epimerase
MKNKQTILITGGAGFIGSHCAKALNKELAPMHANGEIDAILSKYR